MDLMGIFSNTFLPSPQRKVFSLEKVCFRCRQEEALLARAGDWGEGGSTEKAAVQCTALLGSYVVKNTWGTERGCCGKTGEKWEYYFDSKLWVSVFS